MLYVRIYYIFLCCARRPPRRARRRGLGAPYGDGVHTDHSTESAARQSGTRRGTSTTTARCTTTQARTHIARRPQAHPRDFLVETATTPANRMSCGTLRAKLATRSRLLEVESRQDAGIGQSGRLRLVAGASDACDVDRGVGSGDGRAGCLLEDPLDLGDAVATLGDVVRGADGVAHEDRVQLERLQTTSN